MIPLMETVSAGQCIEEICDVPGVDAIMFGPADYSASAGALGEWEGPGVAAQLLEIKDRIRSRDMPCGVLTRDSADLLRRRDQGFQMLGLSTDTGLIIRGLQQGLDTLRSPNGFFPKPATPSTRRSAKSERRTKRPT